MDTELDHEPEPAPDREPDLEPELSLELAAEADPDAGPPDGRIVTFYSFKGGVGRTMALAHVAWILASAGYSVLAVDWDLEAPGLAEYLFPLVGRDGEPTQRDVQIQRGVVELIKRYADEAEAYLFARGSGIVAAADQRTARRGFIASLRTEDKERWLADFHAARLPELAKFKTNFTKRAGLDGVIIDFMPAGQSGRSDYFSDLHDIDWKYIRDHLGGDSFLNTVRDRMKRRYNFTLIDSRTGLTESALVTTTWLADSVALVFSSNSQNITKAEKVAHSIVEESAEIPREVDILPVPSRLESGDLVARERFRIRYEEAFREYASPGSEFSLPEYWREVPIMYDPDYSYFESPPTRGPSRVLDSMQFLASVITQRRDLALTAPAGWDDFLARFRQQPPLAYDVVIISYTQPDEGYADWICWLLEEHDVTVQHHRADLHDRWAIPERIDGTAENDIGPSFCVLPLLSPAYLDSAFGGRAWSWARRHPDVAGHRSVLSPVRVADLAGRHTFRKTSSTTAAEQPQEVSIKGDPWLDLVGKDQVAARNAILAAIGARRLPDGTYAELVSANEARRQQEPPYPGRSPWSDPADGTADGHSTGQDSTGQHSAGQFWKLLEEAAAWPAQADGYLGRAATIGEARGDLLAAAVARYRQVTWVTGQPRSDVEDAVSRATADTLRLAETDLFAVGGSRGESTLRISSFDLGRRTLRFLVEAIQGAHREQPASVRAKLAEAAVQRSQRDYQLAGNLCRDAHFDAVTGDEIDRCELELTILSLYADAAPMTRDRLEALRARFRRVRRDTADPDTVFLAFLYEGVANTMAGRTVTPAYRNAAACYEQALSSLGHPLEPTDAAGGNLDADEVRSRNGVYWARQSLVLTYMADLGRISGLWAEGLQTAGFDQANQDTHFVPALAHVTDLWPLCSLPLAHALENGCHDPGVTVDERRARVLAALWIYTSFGRQLPGSDATGDVVARCAGLALELDADPLRPGQLLRLPDPEQVAHVLRAHS